MSKRQTDREVLSDPFLEKQSISQLALLDEEEYTTGLARIEQDINQAEQQGKEIEFRTEIVIFMWSGLKI